MKQPLRILAFCLAVLLPVCLLTGCDLFAQQETTPSVVQTTDPRQAIDADVSEVLRSFFVNDLPSMALRSGVKDQAGEEIRCDYSMLKKSVFVDFDGDGAKEIVLLFDVSEPTGKRNQSVAVYLDEKDGSPSVVFTESAVFGASSGDEAYILTRYDNRICKVRFVNKSAYQAVLIDTMQGGKWKTILSAYRHSSDHDGVKLENGSCYIDHSGGELYQAAIGKKYYSKEKFLNFRTPADNFDSLVTSLLAETLLP